MPVAQCAQQVCFWPFISKNSLSCACLEGVWMSVSPTEDALIVALDFEGAIECITPSGFTVISNLPNNRRPQPRAFSAGGHASRTFQYSYFKSCVYTVTLSLLPFLSHRNHRFYFVTTLLLVATSVASFSLSSPARLY